MVERLRWHNQDYPVSLWLEHAQGSRLNRSRVCRTGRAAHIAAGIHYLSFWPDEQFLIDYFDMLLTARGIATVRLPGALRLRRHDDLVFAFNRAAAPIAAPGTGRRLRPGRTSGRALRHPAWRAP